MKGDWKGLQKYAAPFVLEAIKELGGTFSDRLLSAPKGVLIIFPFSLKAAATFNLKGVKTMKEEYELVFGSNLSFTPNVVGPITIDETQRRVNELMGVSDMDVVRQLSKRSLDESMEGIDEDILQVAGMMGLDETDLERYGYKKEPSSEIKTDVVDQVTIDEDISQVAELMGVDPLDIEKFGNR
ncbi:MAG TPA: hypothetical protein VMW09_06845 [Desulfatiglandales bacterium]|nr:hypothetical protein [Desulfatiglandales bacterium]